MNNLDELLHEIADDAKFYDRIDEALVIARRRRRVTRLAPLAVAALVAAGLIVALLPSRPGPDPDPVAQSPDQPVPSARVVSWLPTLLTARSGPPPLPSDRAVGVASLIYWPATAPAPASPSPGTPDRAVLVTAEGAQYGLAESPFRYLSADGRWLLTMTNGRIVLRDLTATRVMDLAAYRENERLAVASANDGSRLALQHGTTVTVADLPSAVLHDVTVGGPEARLCGLPDSGHLLLCETAPSKTRMATWLLDVATATRTPSATVDVSSALKPSEYTGVGMVGDWQLAPLSSGTDLFLRIQQYDAKNGVTVPGDLLKVDLRTGRPVGRLTVPPYAPPVTIPQSGGVRFVYPDGRDAVTTCADGVLLTHWTSTDGTPVTRELELVNPVTGARTVTTVITGGVRQIILRGSWSRT